MEKIVEDQDSGDEDDPVVREIDVFLSQNMPGVRDPQVRRISSPARECRVLAGGTVRWMWLCHRRRHANSHGKMRL